MHKTFILYVYILKFLLCHPGWLGIRTGSRLALNSEKSSRLCLTSAFLKHVCHHAKSYICSLNNCFTYLLLLLFVCACVHASEHGWIVQQFLRVSSLFPPFMCSRQAQAVRLVPQAPLQAESFHWLLYYGYDF